MQAMPRHAVPSWAFRFYFPLIASAFSASLLFDFIFKYQPATTTTPLISSILQLIPSKSWHSRLLIPEANRGTTRRMLDFCLAAS